MIYPLDKDTKKLLSDKWYAHSNLAVVAEFWGGPVEKVLRAEMLPQSGTDADKREILDPINITWPRKKAIRTANRMSMSSSYFEYVLVANFVIETQSAVRAKVVLDGEGIVCLHPLRSIRT